MAYIIQVNPVDLQRNIALGIDLPMIGEQGSTFKQNYYSMDQAIANAKNLLLTEPGERVMLPTFGAGLKRALFEQLTAEALLTLEARIKTTFRIFLPYIFIQKLELTPDNNANTLYIRLDISLSESGIDTRSILLEVNG